MTVYDQKGFIEHKEQAEIILNVLPRPIPFRTLFITTTITTTSSSTQEVEAVAEGAISVQPLVQTLPGFDQYFSSLQPETNTRNPWFPEYWEAYLGCSPDDSSCTPSPFK